VRLPRRKSLVDWMRRPTFWVALALIAVGFVGLAFGRQNKLREWAPNIAASAFALAITITVVEWIVRREARARIRPRVERVIYWMGLAFRGAIVIDYAGTHRDSFKPIPEKGLEMIDLWLAEDENEDRPRKLLEGQRLPMLLLGRRNSLILLRRLGHAIWTCLSRTSFERSMTLAGMSVGISVL
jgi:hypothetical protein